MRHRFQGVPSLLSKKQKARYWFIGMVVVVVIMGIGVAHIKIIQILDSPLF